MAATESNPIIFYDIESAPDLPEAKAWSPSTWKTRLTLNYKRLPYKTIYLSLPEIAPTLQGLGLEPPERKTGPFAFTLPVIIDPTPSGPKVVRDSAEIARYLDATYPDPERTLFPSGSHALQAYFDRTLNARLLPLCVSLIVPLVPSILDEKGAEYYNRTRAELLGKPLSEVRPKGADLDKAWESFKAELDVVVAALQNNDVERGGPGGSYLMGNKFSFVDCVMVGLFIWMNKVKPEADGNAWERIKGWHNGRWERLWKKSEEFMQVD
ncbi:hypothetical protein BOTBODRAFT_185266 [Botryobasidium botryosum FD-172 SS1]|uniref:GST N-terminal domain-containing protein n=1 Tax=Botryobasidium botryosum (strain FD-172 SS1) TaxID=930990 RepID=A0A067MQL0_BOTB1|nr:hypothetical protein BOTBODRAFT_185266 [Botryobasidium botryosum FD-172 SS1]